MKFKFPELRGQTLIEWDMHVTPHDMHYDMILGRDLLFELGIQLDFDQQVIRWHSAEIPMRSVDEDPKKSYFVKDSEHIVDATERIKKILEAKYEPANIDVEVDKCTHLDERQRNDLKELLRKHSKLFDGSLGQWKGSPYKIDVQPDAVPFHSRAYPIPRIHEKTLRMEVDRLCELGVLKQVNRSEWGAPTFIIPKKDGTVRFISDFRELNKRIKRKPFPLP